AAPSELRLDQLQALHELREQEHLVTFREQRLQELEQRVELARAQPVAPAGERGVAADLTQARERREHRHAILLQPLSVREERAEERGRAPQLGQVEPTLSRGERAVHALLDARRQLLRDLLLQPAQEQRAEPGREQAAPVRRRIGLVVAGGERRARAEEA